MDTYGVMSVTLMNDKNVDPVKIFSYSLHQEDKTVQYMISWDVISADVPSI